MTDDVSPFLRLLITAEPPILSEAALARRIDMDRLTVRNLRTGKGGRLVRSEAAKAIGCTEERLLEVIAENVAWEADARAEQAAAAEVSR